MKLSGTSVLVTGAGGYLGSHLAEALVRRGAKVTGLVHYRSDGSWGWLDHSPLAQEMRVIPGDVRDAGFVRHLPSAGAGLDIVFHLAALVSIPYSHLVPESFLETNLMGTLNLLELAKAHRACFLLCSSSEVYGTGQTRQMDESHPLCPRSPYAASKLAADQLALAYCRGYGVPVTIVRPFNSFGPRQSQRAAIPSFILQALGGGPVYLAHPNSHRDWTYVDDTVRGFILAAEAEGIVGKVFNLATGQAHSVREVADLVVRLVNPGLPVLVDPTRERPEESEVDWLCGSSRHAWDILRWRAEISFEEGVQRAIDWFREHRQLYHRPSTFQI